MDDGLTDLRGPHPRPLRLEVSVSEGLGTHMIPSGQVTVRGRG